MPGELGETAAGAVAGWGKRLKELRVRRGLTQVELAVASGLSASLVKKAEEGDYGDIRVESARRLAEVVGVPVAVLMTGEGMPVPGEVLPVARGREAGSSGRGPRGVSRGDLAAALRGAREASGLSGERLAARCGLPAGRISRIETGRVLPSAVEVECVMSALGAGSERVTELVAVARRAQVAAVLGDLSPEEAVEAAYSVRPPDELGEREGREPAASAPVPASPVTPRPPDARWAAGIYDAVIHPVEAARHASRVLDKVPALPSLRQRADTAVAAELAADYARLAAVLPRLIGTAEFAALQVPDRDHAEAYDVVAQVYTTAAWAMIKADAAGAAWIAAQRAVQAAEAVGDGLRAAAATRCLAEVHMRAGEYSDATRTAFLAATYLYSAPPDDVITLVLRGSALLSAAAASARRGDAREARASFTAAVACAEPMHAERSDFGAVFGPVNTAVHRVAIAVELGDHKTAVDAIPAVNLTRLPASFAERRARYLIDVARAHAGLRDDQAAEDALLEAERAAPDELRSHRLTRAVLCDLLTRERKSSGVRELAARCGILAG